jgi:hypothetical protein
VNIWEVITKDYCFLTKDIVQKGESLAAVHVSVAIHLLYSPLLCVPEVSGKTMHPERLFERSDNAVSKNKMDYRRSSCSAQTDLIIRIVF